MKIWSELRRRNVPRMAVLYLVSAWLILQVTEVLNGLLSLPEWVGPLVLAMLAIGLPIAVALAWFFEIGESGITRDAGEPAAAAASAGVRRVDIVIIAMLAAAILAFAWLSVRDLGPADKSVAVLAFDNMSDDPAQDYFSEGISEEILGTLAKSPQLRVISRSSSFAFRGSGLDVPTIARQLDVAHILEGSVRKAGDRVRISAQLIDAATDTHVWSETFERELTAVNVFDIQTQIANNIAEALNAVLTVDSNANAHRPPTRNLSALEAYLLGKKRMALRSHEGLAESVEYFETAIELDPDYAAAHLGLADAYLLLTQYGHIPRDEALQKAQPAIEKSIELDDQFGAAYASLGLMRIIRGDVSGAESALSRAISLDPNDAKAYHWYGDILIFSVGDPGAAIPMLQKARQLDPLAPVIVVTLGEAQSAAGNLAEGLRLYRKALQIDRAYLSAYNLLGLGYLSIGELEKAAYWFAEGAKRGPDEFVANGGRVFLYLARGDEERAVALARRLQVMAPGNNATLYTLVSFGRDEEAIELAASDWPDLSCESGLSVQRNNVFQAMNLSLAYERTGQRECAEALLSEILEFITGRRGVSPRAYGFLDAEVYARQGEMDRAIATLRASVAAGMRAQWMIQVEGSPHMAALRQDPAYPAIRAIVQHDLALQLDLVRQMEARGELAPLGE